MTEGIDEIIEKYYPNDEHMIKWAESMKNKPKDWSNFLLAIAMLLSALLIIVLVWKSNGII